MFFNPKVVIFFVAIFSQFLSAEQLISTQVFAALMAGLIDAAWYALVGILASNQRFAATLTGLTGYRQCVWNPLRGLWYRCDPKFVLSAQALWVGPQQSSRETPR